MPYVLIAPHSAEPFNRGLCRLMRPESLRDESYVTDLYCPMHTHPTNGWMALELPDTETVPIHLQADGSELHGVLERFVTDGALTQTEADSIVSAVIATRGQEVRIADFIPASWSAYVFDRAAMEAQGWFPDEESLSL